MVGEGVIARIGVRLIAAGFADTALEIVRHQNFRGSTKVFEHADVAAYPIWQGLTQGCFGIGIVRCAHYTDEDLRLADLAGVPIGDGHRFTAIVHEAFLARQMFLAHHGIELA